jgi:hypothetical protein
MKYLCLLCVLCASSFSACTTTKTESNGTTTTTTGIDQGAGIQAAIAVATQIATAAANAAISTYLTTPHARMARSSNDDALKAAKSVTETEIRKTLPNLSPLRIHNIVSSAYAKELRKQTSSP